MVYRFTLISDEVDDFIREIKIDSEATFHDFHEAILKAAGYKNDQLTSFFICDDDWEKEQEITLEDMGTSSDEDSYIMKETKLSDLLEDEKQKLLYVFDPLSERVFFIELSEIITGKDLDNAICSRKAGEAPKQTLDFDEMMANNGGNLDLDENFYGDQDCDMEDFDPEGFDMGSGSAADPYEQDNYESEFVGATDSVAPFIFKPDVSHPYRPHWPYRCRKDRIKSFHCRTFPNLYHFGRFPPAI